MSQWSTSRRISPEPPLSFNSGRDIPPRWLEILKASGWHTTALAAACVVVLALTKTGIIPTDGSPYWVALPIIGAVVFGILSIANLGRALVNVIDPATAFRRWRSHRAQRRTVLNYLPYMTDKERQIVGYLLHHKQRIFETDQDGGYAAPLIAKGVVCVALTHGQIFRGTRVPFEVPEHIWVLLEKK